MVSSLRRRLPLVLSVCLAVSALPAGAQVLLDPLTQPRFVNPLPNPLDPGFVYRPLATCPQAFPDDCDACYVVGAYQVEQQLGLVDPMTGAPLTTTVYGYGTGPGFPAATFPGRTFVVRGDADPGDGVALNEKACVQWENKLPAGGGHLLPVDESLHWAFSLPGYEMASLETDGVPMVPHVHGGHTESDSDGLPEYWWTPDESLTGPRFVKSLYEYDNDQQAGTVWYHDHGLGITRLNVYAGLAGFFLVRDERDTGAADNPLGLPAWPYELPLAIQDRQFTADGQLFYPTVPMEVEPGFPPPPDPSALPEFFGDFILVNGQAWPVASVEPTWYRLRLLNGSDSRFYELWIDSGAADGPGSGTGPVLWVVGTDVGLLHRPVARQRLVIGPGERYDVVVSFAGHEGQQLIVRNNARSPFPKGGTVDPLTTGRIMAFAVGDAVTSPHSFDPTAALRPSPIDPEDDLGEPVRTRKLLLFEGLDQFGRLQPMLGVAAPTANVEGEEVDGTQLWDEMHYPITENPMLDDVEVWEVYNTTADAHPIHLHLVAFQLLGRQKFKGDIAEKEMEAHDGSTSIGGTLGDIRLLGQPRPAEAYEAGWKDTAIMYPGEVTRVVARFDRPGRYVWHCHILSHEDHEMMRPYHVGPLTP